MLNKSKRSALLIGALIVVSFMLSMAVMTMLIPYLLSGDIHTVIEKPENLNTPGAVLSLAAVLLALTLLLIAISAYCLYRFFGQAYYGQRGALRWLLFSLGFPLIGWLPGALFPGFRGILSGIWQFSSIFLAYALSRWLIPLRK